MMMPADGSAHYIETAQVPQRIKEQCRTAKSSPGRAATAELEPDRSLDHRRPPKGEETEAPGMPADDCRRA